MKLLPLVTVGILILGSIGGCGWSEIKNGSKKPQMSWVTVTDKGAVQAGLLEESPLPGGTNVLGYVITWPAQFNAAFVGPDGEGCVQPAAYVTTSSGSITTPAELEASGIAKGDINAVYSQAVTELLAVSDEQTRLSIGMYGICQLVVAGGLTAAQASEAVLLLLDEQKGKQVANSTDGSN